MPSFRYKGAKVSSTKVSKWNQSMTRFGNDFGPRRLERAATALRRHQRPHTARSHQENIEMLRTVSLTFAVRRYPHKRPERCSLRSTNKKSTFSSSKNRSSVFYCHTSHTITRASARRKGGKRLTRGIVRYPGTHTSKQFCPLAWSRGVVHRGSCTSRPVPRGSGSPERQCRATDLSPPSKDTRAGSS